MKIAIDVDDVLGEFFQGFRDFYFKKRRQRLAEDFFNEEIFTQNPDKGQAVGDILDYLDSPDLQAMLVTPGAPEAVRRLSGDHELYVVTGRPQSAMARTERWLNRNFGRVFKAFYSTDYHLVNQGAVTKGDICRRLGVDLHIDDFYKYALECLGYQIPVFLFSRPWNQKKELVAGLTRVDSWPEITKIIYERKN